MIECALVREPPVPCLILFKPHRKLCWKLWSCACTLAYQQGVILDRAYESDWGAHFLLKKADQHSAALRMWHHTGCSVPTEWHNHHAIQTWLSLLSFNKMQFWLTWSATLLRQNTWGSFKKQTCVFFSLDAKLCVGVCCCMFLLNDLLTCPWCSKMASLSHWCPLLSFG